MRKIVAGLFISLDGVYERPNQWHLVVEVLEVPLVWRFVDAVQGDEEARDDLPHDDSLQVRSDRLRLGSLRTASVR